MSLLFPHKNDDSHSFCRGFMFYLCYLYLKEKFEDTKGVMRSRKLKKDRQHNMTQKKTDKRTNNDLQNITQKLKIEKHEPH